MQTRLRFLRSHARALETEGGMTASFLRYHEGEAYSVDVEYAVGLIRDRIATDLGLPLPQRDDDRVLVDAFHERAIEARRLLDAAIGPPPEVAAFPVPLPEEHPVPPDVMLAPPDVVDGGAP